MKKDMNPSFTPYFFKKSYPKFYLTQFLPFECWLPLAYQLIGTLLTKRTYSETISTFVPLSVSALKAVPLFPFSQNSLHSHFFELLLFSVVWELPLQVKMPLEFLSLFMLVL